MTGTLKALVIGMGVLVGSLANAADEFIVLQSTTSTRNSGLLDALIPKFEAISGIEVRVVAVGTGQALRNAQNGDGDVLMVHAKLAEEEFVANGWGVKRFDLMYNDFVVVGPGDDPAGVESIANVTDLISKIAKSGEVFVSRGDDSGTHRAELGLWSQAGIDVAAASGTWYRETGAGMGTTLNIGIGMGGYMLTDRASWATFGHKAGFRILGAGDKRLLNQYGIILVNPARHPRVNAVAGQAFIDWLTGETGQALIADFSIAGQQLFFPNANVVQD
ncbi:MAG: substrate-binding domain-containing protein [Paracoccaceae bacterium]